MKLPRLAAATIALGLAVIFAVVPTNITTPAAADSVIPPDVPPALNVLPSTIKGALTGTAKGDALAVMLYKFSKTPLFWAAARAAQSGTATPVQAATVASGTAGYAVPATKLAGLTRVLGGVGYLVSGYTMGTSLGNGIVSAFGIDSKGLVCGSSTPGLGQAMAGFLTGTDCSDFEQLAADYQANMGVPTGVQFQQICHPARPANCYTLTIVGASQYSQGGIKFRTQFCVQQTGSNLTASENVTIKTLDGTVMVQGQQFIPQSNPPCNGLYGNGSSIAAYMGFTTQAAAEAAALTARTICFSVASGSASCRVENVANGIGVELDHDPVRQLKCVLLATTGQTTTAWTLPYRESEGAIPVPNCTPLAGGLTMESMTVSELVNGTLTELWSEESTPEYGAAHELAPECDSGTCLLDLRKDSVSCFQTPVPCANWFASPTRDTDYTCHYGTHAVDLSECFVYSPSFDPQNQATGNTLADPDGVQLGAPSGATPGKDGTTFGTAVQDPSKARQCFPTGWAALNPVEWVTKPVQCAIEWAFVPRQAALTTARNGWQAKLNASVFAQVGAITSAFVELFEVNSAGCQGPPFRIQFGPGPLFGEGGMDETYYPFSACSEPMAGFANVFNVLSLMLMFIAAQMASIRYVAGIFGYVSFGKGVTSDRGETDSSGASFNRTDGSSVRFK